MTRLPLPLVSAAIYAALTSLIVWALWGHDFALTPEVLAGLAFVALLWVAGVIWFGGRFVRPRWKIPGKGVAALTITYLAMVWLGPYGLLIPVLHQASGMIGHIVICRKHGIDWRTSEPRDRYIALQEKWARGDFN